MSFHEPDAFTQGAEIILERRMSPRSKVMLQGVCSIAGSDDIPCSILDLSLGGARLACATSSEIGAPVFLLMPHLGLVAARVARVGGDGIGITFTSSVAQRRRIQDYLVVALDIRDDRAAEDRAFDRIVPLRRTIEIRRADGRAHMARIREVSRSGVALTTTVTMAIGEEILVGATPAEVVRVFDGGAAARFLALLPPTFDPTIVL